MIATARPRPGPAPWPNKDGREGKHIAFRTGGVPHFAADDYCSTAGWVVDGPRIARNPFYRCVANPFDRHYHFYYFSSRLTHVTKKTALRDLADMLSKGVVQRIGTTGRGAWRLLKRVHVLP